MNNISRLRQWLSDRLPDSPYIRIPIGVLFVLFGFLGFLPVLGFWMVPVGLMILAIDFPPARRLARWLIVKVGRLIKPNHKRHG